MITTKKGNLGKPVITYSGNYELQKVTITPKVGNAYEFAVLTTENEINQGNASWAMTYLADNLTAQLNIDTKKIIKISSK